MSCTEELRAGHSTPFTGAEQCGSITSLDLVAMLCLRQPRIAYSLFDARTYCWLMDNLMFTTTPTSFSAKLLVPRGTGAWYSCLSHVLCPLLNCMRFPSGHFSSLLRSHWMAAQCSGVSASPPSFVSSRDLLGVHSAPSSRSSVKILTRPSLEPSGACHWPPTRHCTADYQLPHVSSSESAFNPPCCLLH